VNTEADFTLPVITGLDPVIWRGMTLESIPVSCPVMTTGGRQRSVALDRHTDLTGPCPFRVRLME
jgi:hypothetical protein